MLFMPLLIDVDIVYAETSGMELQVQRVGQLPTIDGIVDTQWDKAKKLISTDPISKVPITLRAQHDGDSIAILATYPDETENRNHRALLWNKETSRYKMGPTREDVLVLKWRLSNDNGQLTLSEDNPYQADVWFWKALRTDPVGFADDKRQIYSLQKLPKSKLMVSPSGQFFYLSRLGDKGKSSYKSALYHNNIGPQVPKYKHRQPTDSRADIQAKGQWKNGQWTIELKRKLDTGHTDDIKLNIGASHDFAVSRYEVAGRKPEPSTEQPLYGSGEVGPIIKARLMP